MAIDYQIQCRHPECEAFSSEPFCPIHRNGGAEAKQPGIPEPQPYVTPHSQPLLSFPEGSLWIPVLVILVAFGLAIWAESRGNTGQVEVYKPNPMAPPRVSIKPGHDALDRSEQKAIQERYNPANTNAEQLEQQIRKATGYVPPPLPDN